MARLRAADRTRRVSAGAGARRSDPRPPRSRRTAPAPGVRRGAPDRTERRATAGDRRLRAVRERGARLELLPEGVCGRRRDADPRGARARPARLRRHLATGPRRPRARAGGRRAALAAARARARPGGRLRQAAGRARQARGQRARTDGAAAARPLHPRWPPLQRPRAAAHFGAARRELGLARVQGLRHGPDRGPADLRRAAAAARSGHAARTAAHGAAGGAA